MVILPINRLADLKVLMVTFILGFFISSVLAAPDAIYGVDNRIDVFESNDSLMKKVAFSTASMIPKEYVLNKNNRVEITAPLYKNLYNLCPSERFRNQLTASTCSGTLIASDIILTAGHCFSHGNLECNGNFWVFDYHASSANQEKITIPSSSIYKCKKIMVKENLHDPNQMIDFALIKLDREVKDRAPVKIRLSGTIRANEKIVLIGNPRGLPTKIAGGAQVKDVFSGYFLSNVDAFLNNSGSGIFNQKTGELEGILVSGLHDFETNATGCTISSIFDDNKGAEMVTNVEVIWEFIKTLSPNPGQL